jgi:hypothetical protein
MNNKLTLFIIGLFCILTQESANSQSNVWTWVSGDSTAGQYANFGTKYIASSTNTPSARVAATGAVDSNGNFWLFGGQGPNGLYELEIDLWKYNENTNEWTWMGGVDTSDYFYQGGLPDTIEMGVPTFLGPGGRDQAASWVDSSGNFWIFGGLGVPIDGVVPGIYYGAYGRLLSDLWMFNVTTNQWIWEGGDSSSDQPSVYGIEGVPSSNNIPTARYESAYCQDSHFNFWLFGGYESPNDLWKFSPSNKEWTWVNGNTNPFYGIKGVASDSTQPVGRWDATVTADKYGNLWMYGGVGGGNDLWKYNIQSNEWTWVTGDSGTYNLQAVYGQKGIRAPGNTPGERDSPLSWTDSTGNFWLFGGNSDLTPNANDLWEYNIGSGLWAWVGGDSSVSDYGGNAVFGVEGQGRSTATPGGRIFSMQWEDAKYNFWLFGGEGLVGYPDSCAGCYLNDLWEYSPVYDLLVTLTYFTASLIKNTSNLSWQTASEQNCDYFEVERSSNSIDFEAIGNVKGHGNSNVPKDYSFIDKTPITGTNYYRLRQVDFDGHSIFSKTVSVQFLSEDSLLNLIYPNPARTIVNIPINEFPFPSTVEIYSSTGKLVLQQDISTSNLYFSVNIQKLDPGIYLIKLNQGTQQTVWKFIKQ